jgi:hypothetical protein
MKHLQLSNGLNQINFNFIIVGFLYLIIVSTNTKDKIIAANEMYIFKENFALQALDNKTI